MEELPAQGTLPMISCVVCAYNEADKISEVLRILQEVPGLSELIVVDDGSSDCTAERVSAHTGIRLVSYAPNRGKTHALRVGMKAAAGRYILLIDADLKGLTARDVQALIDPVLSGRAEVSISLRGNSLPLYRNLGLDFVSGERFFPAALIRPHLDDMRALPRWGAEVYLNSLITRAGMSIAVVTWPTVFNVRKVDKVGAVRGRIAELAMTLDVFRVLSPATVISQNVAMLRLRTTPRRARQPINRDIFADLGLAAMRAWTAGTRAAREATSRL